MFSKLKEFKWLLAFAIACVAIIAATVVAIVLGVKLNKANQIPEYSEGDEVGVYYYEVADGEVVLTLSGGNKFTIAGPGLNKTGEYCANETGFVFDFIRDEDGEATATIEGDTIPVTFKDGTKMTFLKKVSYTVSFNQDGTNVTTVTVINGKTASKPQDPVRNGYVFLGWYADAAFTTPYAFDSSIIKANTTIYARWAQKGPEGAAEYTVDLNLGYGDTVLDVTTIGGKVYDLPTPEREGYTFGGWYISMYEDGNKLTYAYTADTVFTADTTLFAVWYDNASTKLNAPAVSVSGNAVKWDSVNGAQSYSVIITAADGTEIAKAENVGTTNYAFDFAAYPAGEYTVSVVAISSDSAKNSDAAVRAYANKTLDRVTEFNVINGIVVFNAVEGAEKYFVTVDCGNPNHKHTSFDNGTSTTFDILNCTMQKGGIKITVTASAKGYANSVSKTYVYERNLLPVTGVTYDAVADVFTWNPVENATSYYVEVIVGETSYKLNVGNKTSFAINEYTGEVTVKVTPVTDGFNSPDATEGKVTKVAPPVPTGLTVSGNIVSWNEVPGATSYMLKVGNNTLKVDTNSFNIADGQVILVPGDYYTISVQTISATGASVFSKSITAGYLVMNEDISYSANTVTWAPVIGASNYLVRVNGGETISVNGTSVKVKLTKSGINVIEVKYTDLGGSKWVSTEVYAYAVTYMSRSLAGETTEYIAIGDTMTLPADFDNDGFNFDGWYNTPAAADGNGKEITTATFTFGRDMVLYANWAPKSFKVELQTGGYEIDNLQDKTTADATYTKEYYLPVPHSTAAGNQTFIGWYTMPSGEGVQLTDEEGKSIDGYPFPRDTVAYPFFDTGVLSYLQKKDGTYAVRMGQLINKVKKVIIPEFYNGSKVTTILENGFADCNRLVTIEIPDTIELIGTGAFSGCTRLESINIYEVKGNHERLYFSDDGVLIYNDLGTNYLEVVPRAKTGTYVMCENIQIIRNKAFNYSKLSSVVISKSVTTISSRAFNNCTNLESVDFVEGRVQNVTFENDSFYKCNNVKSFKIPTGLEALNLDMLQSLTSLSTVTVEKGHALFGSVNGLLTDSIQSKILFVPAAYVSGNFTIPSGIQEIGDRAFEGCTGITAITIPNFVTTIGANAFNRCTGIKTVTFVGDRKHIDLAIGDYAFANCNKLTTVTFGGSKNGTDLDTGKYTIGISAFVPSSATTAAITSVVFENGANVESIGASAFSGQALINTLNFGTARIASIGDRAFYGCTNISTVTIPATTTSVGAYAFANCSGITSLAIADGSTALAFGEYAFADCVRLTTVYLPASVSEFNGAVFSGCNALKAIVVDEDNTSLKSIGGVLYNFAVTSLKFYPIALVEEKGGAITLADLPDTLTTIDKAVFKGNKVLTSFAFGANITSIGYEAFSECSNLTTVTFASSESADAALVIDAYAFYKCPFTDISTLPAYVTTIGDYAFYAGKFASFPAPAKLTSIGAFAFSGNTALLAITIPENVATIADGAFAACTKLATLEIKPGETPLTIGTDTHTTAANGAFYNTRLAAVTLPDRVTEIGAYAFTTNNTSTSTSTNTIRSFTAGSGLKRIGFGAFYLARRLDNVTLNEGLEYIGNYAFSNAGYASGSTRYGITSVTIPSTVTYLGKYAFGGFSGAYYNALQSVTFTEGGTAPLVIGSDAFAYSHITNVQLPKRALAYKEGVENTLYGVAKDSGLEYKTFYLIFNNCTKLENITVEAGSTQFTSIDGILYVLDENNVATTLLYCPQANKGVDGVVTIPNTVTLVENAAFYNTTGIHTVKFAEFADTDANYKQPLLYLGNFVSSEDSTTRTEARGVFCGSANKITRVELPSHLAYVGAYSVSLRGTSDACDVTIVFNPNATIQLSENAIQYLDTEEIKLPNVSGLLGRDYISNSTAKKISFGANSTFTHMPSYGIHACNNLETFEIPAKVVSLGTAAFYDCTGIKTITFASNNTLVTVNAMAFRGLSSLTSIVFPKTVESIGSSVFSDCDSLTSVTLPESLKEFTASIFNGADALETVVLENNSFYKVADGALYDVAGSTLLYFPIGKEVTTFTVLDTVTSIGPRAFYGFKGTSIVLPANLESIGASAFQNSNLTEVILPDKVNQIGEYAFAGCKALTTFKMNVNGNITSIGHRIFENNSALTTVILSDNIKEFGEGVFYGCSSLTGVTLPSALTSIPKFTFEYCTNLAAVTIPSGVDFIGNQSFAYTEKLETVTIPAAVKNIEDYAFINSKNLRTVIFEKDSLLENLGVGYNYGKVFADCPNLTEIDLSGCANLTAIGPRLFENSTAVTTVKLAGTAIVELPNEIFKGLTNLTTVTLPETLVKIGDYAFQGATALENIVIPATVDSIGVSAFEDCTALKTVTFEEGSVLTVLGTSATANDNIFKNTTSLETVVLPSVLEVIGGHVFENSGVQAIYQNNGINEVSFPAALTTIGEYAFSNCDRLGEVVIFGNTSYVGGYAFNDCDELTDLTLSEGVSFIGSLAFAYCEKLEAVALPLTITKLDGNPFAGCIGLTSFTLHEDNTAYKFIDGILYDWTAYTLVFNPVSNTATSLSLPDTVYEIAAGAFVGSHIESLTLPSKITTIPDYAFANCEELKTVKLSNSITSIGNYAFSGCTQLNNVVIPKSVNEIGNYAFANCTDLTAFRFEDKDATDAAYKLGTYLFDGCTALTTAVVPNRLSSSSLPAYMFHNTGLVDVTIPANVTSLNSEGVFANCAKLETITFEGVVLKNATIGKNYFRNCVSLQTYKDTTNPTDINKANSYSTYSMAGCTGLEYAALSGYGYVGTYAFSGCTGLKDFRFNSGEYYGAAAFSVLDSYAFQNCTGIDTLWVIGAEPDGYYTYESNVFDGWTVNQKIVFLNDTEGFPRYGHSGYNSKFLDGCNAEIIWQDDLFTQETVNIDYIGILGVGYDPSLSAYAGKNKVVNIGEIGFGTQFSENGEIWGSSLFYNWTAEQTINFTEYGYEEILEFIERGSFNEAVFKNCSAKICDKDGNVLVIDVATGAVTSVTNADGSEALWTPEA